MNNNNIPKNIDNQAPRSQPEQTTPVRQNLADRQINPPRPQPQQTAPRRPLNNEERRRLEAARQAALKGTAAGISTAVPPRPTQAPGTRPTQAPGARPAPAPAARSTGTEAAGQARPSQPRPAAPMTPQNTARPRPISQTEQPAPVSYIPPQRNVTPDGEYVRDYQNNQPSRNNMTPKKKKRIKIPWGIIVFIIIIAAVVIVAAKHILDNPPEPNNDGPTIIETSETDDIVTPPETGDAEETDTPETEEPPVNPYGFSVNHPNTDIDVGNLILVNYEHPYARVDSVFLTNVRANKTSTIQVSATNAALAPDAFAAIDKMTLDLNATGCEEYLLLSSGYRNMEAQQNSWDKYLAQKGEEYVKMYVAEPGHSEHHTGLAADLAFIKFLDGGGSATYSVEDHEFGSWLWANCADYGFILRYESDKTDITHIAYEAWHFRYVGVPHAYAVNALDMCFEEYIEYIKQYNATSNMLHIKPDGTIADINVVNAADITEGWVTYFVPMAEGETTEIIIPFSETDFDFEISGNNVDGFIVTVSPKTAN